MLARKLRVPSEDFKKAKSKLASTRHFSVRGTKNQESYNRFGFIISSKTEPKSTRRHFLKRKMALVVRKWPQLNFDFIIILEKKVAPEDYPSITEELKKINLKKNV